MARQWLAIAKAEFYVLTSSMKGRRNLYTGILFAVGVVWAAIIAPMLIGFIMNSFIPMEQIRVLLMVMFPGIMRSVMMFLWFLLLLIPMSYALQEIKIGQWEIFLANNVGTRDILMGTFLGKLPLYGLLVLFLAPVLISPFALAFEVSLLGQALMYSAIVVMVLSTIWLSNFIIALVQAKLGDSPRGNDLAKALAFVVALIVIIPMYAVMLFAPQLSELMGMNIFLVFPFTWNADVVSWLAITFNGIGLTESQILAFGGILQLDLLTSAALMGLFVLVGVGIALFTADRVFTISAGVRTDVVTTVGRENLILRGIRRVSRGSFGVLVVTNLKDFFRKAQNLSKLAYGIILIVLMPIMMQQIGQHYTSPLEMTLIIGMMMAMMGTLPFAGTGFLESKDQLWIIRSVPSGASRFVKGRLASAFLIAVPLAVIPTIAICLFFQSGVFEFLVLLLYNYTAVCGAAMVATGITARNPNYEDTKSPAHQTNMMMSMLIAEFSMMGLTFVDMFLGMELGIDMFAIIESVVGPGTSGIVMSFIGESILLLLGLLLLLSGIRSLSRPEN